MQLSEFITLLTAASGVQHQAQAQHPKTPASKHRSRNGTSARGKVRENTSKETIPVRLPPVPWRPGLNIKSVNLRKKKQQNFTWTSVWGPRKGRSFQIGTKSCTLYSWKDFIYIIAILGRIARCNSEIRPLILPLCLLHWLYSFRLWSHHSCLVQAPLYQGWGIKMGFNWKAEAEQGMMKTHHLPWAAITMAKFRM